MPPSAGLVTMIRVRCIVSQGQQAIVELGDPLMLVTEREVESDSSICAQMKLTALLMLDEWGPDLGVLPARISAKLEMQVSATLGLALRGSMP